MLNSITRGFIDMFSAGEGWEIFGRLLAISTVIVVAVVVASIVWVTLQVIWEKL